MPGIKEQLHEFCIKRVQQNIREISITIADLREAMHNETKSSMGDKYETTREMLQQDINMNQQRLSKANADMAILNSLNPENTAEHIMPGSLVITDVASYYIAISTNTINIGCQKYYTVSTESPVALLLKGKRAGDEFTLNGKPIRIQQIL